MKTKTVEPVQFPCSRAFDEAATNEQVYQQVGQPLLDHAEKGGLATLLMFGQTGSGKSYTMLGIEQALAGKLFTGRQRHVVVQFIELAGQNCNDLLQDENSTGGATVRIVDQDDGTVNYANALSIPVNNHKDFKRLLRDAKQRRATEATDKNSVSSRSHAICQITLFEQEQRLGVLTLVDAAGSERRNDSMYHSRSRQDESVEINKSIYALKECIRARTLRKKKPGTFIPYRASNLTRVLRESFERPDAELAIIATVAPNASDTEHTYRTLETVLSLWGMTPTLGPVRAIMPQVSKPLDESPSKWSHDDLVKWLSQHGCLGDKPVPTSMDGKAIMKMTSLQFRLVLFRDSKCALFCFETRNRTRRNVCFTVFAMKATTAVYQLPVPRYHLPAPANTE